eukprot:gene19419-biopygen39540
MHNLMGWSERGSQTEAQAENRVKDLARRLLYRIDVAKGLVGPRPTRWLIITEISKASPTLFARLERELTAYVTTDFPYRLDRRQRQRTWGGLNVIVEGDCMQLDPVVCQSFWADKPLPKVQVGIDLFIDEFSGANFIELTQQCRVVDNAYLREVLQPLRESDTGPTAEGIRMLRTRIANPDKVFSRRIAASGMRLACYTNAQKCAHMRHRTRLYAINAKQRLYWSLAKDLLKGEGARRAWKARWGQLSQQKAQWLRYDDKKRGCRMGCLPLVIGMPMISLDHVNKEQHLVAGLRGALLRIEFDGPPPSQMNICGEYICKKVPVAVTCKFDGFAQPITVGRSWVEWRLAEEGTTIRTLQQPVGPDYGKTSYAWQGETCPANPGLLVDLNFPFGADLTAGYIMLSRVRALAGLHLLRDFDPATLRRNASKSNVDITWAFEATRGGFEALHAVQGHEDALRFREFNYG